MKLLARCFAITLLLPTWPWPRPAISLSGGDNRHRHPAATAGGAGGAGAAALPLPPRRRAATGERAPAGPRHPLLVGTPQSHPEIAALARAGSVAVSTKALGAEGFVLKALPGARPRVVVTAATPQGVLWAAYALLERLGIGFYLGGDAFAGAGPPQVPADLEVTQRPAFAVRGSLPWYNFLNSPTTWDRDDYRFFFDQMAKMRMNFVGFHAYDNEPFCAYEWEGRLVGGEPVVTARNYGWGTGRGMTTAEFGFGTGDFFFGPEFGSRATTAMSDRDDGIRRAQALLADGSTARGRGLKVCVGFEVTGDPTTPRRKSTWPPA